MADYTEEYKGYTLNKSRLAGSTKGKRENKNFKKLIDKDEDLQKQTSQEIIDRMTSDNVIKAQITAHTTNNEIHTTKIEKDYWNGKLDDVIAGENITIDKKNPKKPVISCKCSGKGEEDAEVILYTTGEEGNNGIGGYSLSLTRGSIENFSNPFVEETPSLFRNWTYSTELYDKDFTIKSGEINCLFEFRYEMQEAKEHTIEAFLMLFDSNNNPVDSGIDTMPNFPISPIFKPLAYFSKEIPATSLNSSMIIDNKSILSKDFTIPANHRLVLFMFVNQSYIYPLLSSSRETIINQSSNSSMSDRISPTNINTQGLFVGCFGIDPNKRNPDDFGVLPTKIQKGILQCEILIETSRELSASELSSFNIELSKFKGFSVEVNPNYFSGCYQINAENQNSVSNWNNNYTCYTLNTLQSKKTIINSSIFYRFSVSIVISDDIPLSFDGFIISIITFPKSIKFYGSSQDNVIKRLIGFTNDENEYVGSFFKQQDGTILAQTSYWGGAVWRIYRENTTENIIASDMQYTPVYTKNPINKDTKIEEIKNGSLELTHLTGNTRENTWISFTKKGEKIPLGGGGIEIGTILPYAGTNIPDGYLLCDGKEVPSDDKYDDFREWIIENADYLYHKGVAHNSVNMCWTPDLTGRTLIGAGILSDTENEPTEFSLGNYGGCVSVGLKLSDLPRHTHRIRGGGGDGQQTRPAVFTDTGNERDSWSDGTPDDDRFGSDIGLNLKGYDYNSTEIKTIKNQINNNEQTKHENMPPYAVVNYIIKAVKNTSGSFGNGESSSSGGLRVEQYEVLITGGFSQNEERTFTIDVPGLEANTPASFQVNDAFNSFETGHTDVIYVAVFGGQIRVRVRHLTGWVNAMPTGAAVLVNVFR